MSAFVPLRGLLGLAALVAPALAHSAPVQTFAPDKNASATVQLVKPTTFRKLQDLDFAYVAVTSAGTATVNPDTDAMTTGGGVVQVGGLPYAALFNAISPTRTVVIIRIPRQPITVTRVGGTETMTVSDWTLSGNSRRTVAAHEPFEFKVGGTLYVNAGQVEGTYVGTFDVDVQYP